MQEEFVESYNKTDLSQKEKTPYSRIDKDKYKYIPIKIVTAQSRATDRGYTLRYIRVEDVENWTKNHQKKVAKTKKKTTI